MSPYFKAVRPDGTTRNGLDWNVPSGTVVRADHNVAEVDHRDMRPRHEGDGISIAKTWKGAAQVEFPTARCCTVTVNPADILAEDGDKVRVRAVTVGEWFDAPNLLRKGCGQGADLTSARLSRANLTGANLTGAHLSGAYLSRTNLAWADFSGADLSGADLSGANLYGANLIGACLIGAHLYGAHLTSAHLTKANLFRADLSRADLSYADLSGTDLTGANLYKADLGEWERSPDGFARKKELP